MAKHRQDALSAIPLQKAFIETSREAAPRNAAIVDYEVFTINEAIWFYRIKRGDMYDALRD